MGKRVLIDGALDALRFRLDTFPAMVYQPLPWLGKPSARRQDGVASRWGALSRIIDDVEPACALDIGAQAGFFTFSIAERGIPVIAVEREPTFYRTLQYARSRLRTARVGILILDLQLETLPILPFSDLTLYMSVWHHHVKSHGIPSAVAMLREIWHRTGKAMVFETGQDEMPEDFGLPDFGGDSRFWIQSMLSRECSGGEVSHIGENAAFSPDGTPCMRDLFLVKRVA